MLSDLHLEHDAHAYSLTDAGADLIVLAGDIHSGTRGIEWAVSQTRDKPVLYVLGNHEYYGGNFPRLQDECRSAAKGTNVTLLEQESVELEGYRFFGATLWTDFCLYGNPGEHSRFARVAMNDYRVIRNNKTARLLDPRETKRYHAETLMDLNEFLDTGDLSRSIVITHHLPSYLSVQHAYRGDPLSSAFASRLDGLIEAKGPAVWVHGHNHDCLDYLIERTRVYSNQRGYPHEAVSRFDALATIDLEVERNRFAGSV